MDDVEARRRFAASPIARLATVRPDGGLALLADRYAAYIESPPTGPLIVVTVTRWRGWSAS